MKSILISLIFVLCFIGFVNAEGTENLIPQCPVCTCHCVTPQCPDVTLNCNPSMVVLPGLWEVRFKGSKKCGTVTLFEDQALIEDQYKGITWLIIDKKTIMEQVEFCE